ncbi:MAG: alkaline phosphatase family protein [Saprospiraceae bacterium]
MKILTCIAFTLLLSFGFLSNGFAQQKTENLIVITLDGFRWQEFYGGLDSALMNNKEFTEHPNEMKAELWAATPEERRAKLLPFFWGTFAKQGQLHGNRRYGSKVNNANRYWFSYPGYNEIFTGYPDTIINSNDKFDNPNENVLEFLNKQPGFQGKVAAFTSWDVFPYILNEKRSGVLVNSAWEDLTQGQLNDRIRYLNEIQHEAPELIGGVRWDFLTWQFATEYLKENHPRVLYIGLDETDDMAHEGKYDHYIAAAHKADKWIGQLWQQLQSDPFYKGKTTLLVTTDHGRGDADKKTWKDHGQKVPDCNQIWFAVMWPDTRALGEVKMEEQLWQQQFAATMAAFLGFDFKAEHEVASKAPVVLQKP